MKYYVGQKYIKKRVVSKEEVIKFAEVSKDNNPLHLDENYAKTTIYGECIAHGMLSASYISAVLGTEFPGIGTVYLEQNIKFVKPIYIGTTVQIEVEIKSLDEKNRAHLVTNIKNENGQDVIIGEAKIILPN